MVPQLMLDATFSNMSGRNYPKFVSSDLALGALSLFKLKISHFF